MKSRVEEGIFLAEDIIPIQGVVILLLLSSIVRCRSADSRDPDPIQDRIPCPILGRGNWCLDLSVTRGESAQGDQSTPARCIIEWHSAVEIRDRPVD